MRKLVVRNMVRCEISGRGKYGRAIGTCTANGRDLQQQRAEGQSQRSRPQQGAAPRSSGSCRIKGNISEHGQIYHVPGGKHYDQTRINEDRGERWFCTEAEARAAAWRRARR